MKTCPTCGRVLSTVKKRCCGKCGRTIGRHDRYHFEGPLVVHNDCANPSKQKPIAETLELLPHD